MEICQTENKFFEVDDFVLPLIKDRKETIGEDRISREANGLSKLCSVDDSIRSFTF